MKAIIFLIVSTVVILPFGSCKKDYICTCYVYGSGGSSYTQTYKYTKKCGKGGCPQLRCEGGYVQAITIAKG